ncbi:hypothetical protein NBRC10512_005380 [Rhodotorula toruloides]|uniref:Uncharacterized protein n=1 Tax=Rhodotorula toruloides (strain NP11) TaxID=1130832 RepID=M7X3I9_RHOT1|nr:uncharacterized protein RHTO_04844 [Rhodotorula toruloides NP11]EMS24665.1 hypothetical protein RHTO_04844 [Rhodotorula toruloides NP11]
MARTALSLIPSPDPDTFTELLVNDLHVPLDSTASMRRWLPGHLWTLAHEWLNAMDEREGIVPPPIPPLPGLPRRLAPIPGVLPVPASPEPSDFLPDAETDLAQAAGSPAAEEGCDDVQVAHGASEDQPLPSSLSQAQPLTRAERLERRLQQKEKQQLEQRRRLDGSGSKDTQSPWTTPLAVRPLARSAASGMRHERCGSPRRKSALASELIAGIAPPSSRYRAPLNERNGSAILQDLFQVGTLRFAPPKEVATSSNLPSIQVVPPTSPQPPTSAPLSPQQIDPLTPDDLSRSPARRPLKRVKVNQLGEPVKRRLHIEPDDAFILPFQFPANS